MYERFRKLLCSVLVVLLVCPPAMAEGIRPAPDAPAANRPGMDAAKNGVPVVNIVRPNGGGVSHNMFHDFNVEPKGVIINNSNQPGVSQLGGVLANNPNFTDGRKASLILNEVTSSNRSLIEGYTEVFGGGQYIFANPNGVTINGGGFIGTPKATVTTGVPRVTGGNVQLDVSRGDVLVDGAGINVTNLDAFEIVSRTARINAEIQANRLDIIAGKGTYDPATGTVTPAAPDAAPAPSVAIDSTALGGMYAGRINLVGTEQGVGVNMQGITQATDNLTLTAQGRIEIRGTASSGNTLSMASGGDSVAVSGTVSATNAANLSAHGTVLVDKTAPADAALIRADAITISGGKLDNRNLVAADSRMDVATDALSNAGALQSGKSAQLQVSGAVTNDGSILGGEELVISSGSVDNTGTIHATGAGQIRSTGTVSNDGSILANDDLTIEAAGVTNTGTLHAGKTAQLQVSGAVTNDGAVLSNGDMAVAAASVTNTGTFHSAGTGLFRVSGTLRNAGSILARNDMTFEGATAGSRMAALLNESAYIESLDGSLTFRADTFRNDNTQFQLVEGAEYVSYQEGMWWQHGDDNDNCWGYFEFITGKAPDNKVKNSGYLTVAQAAMVASVGLDPSRNVFSRGELLAAVAATRAKLVADPDYLTPGQIAEVAEVEGIASQGYAFFVKQAPANTNGVIFTATTTRDTYTGKDAGARMLAYGGITIDGGDVTNNVSVISSATGDITITADTFENVGRDIYERSSVLWGRAKFNNHSSPRYVNQGSDTELVLTAFDHAYGTLDAGGAVSINVAHATNGIVERNGIFKDPDPSTLPRTVDDITAVIDALPARGTFVTNLDPTHPYQIETNPAFTDLNAFLGSDYLMGQIGLDATDLARKRLGDAWYENRLIREQVLDLTGRRFLSSSVTSDTDQVRALMDNALAVREDLNLSIGVALTAEQIAALDRDIVWMETRQVNGEDVLVPVVYLGSSSLDRIATGGTVIAGKDVTVTATGDVQNAGVLVADNGLTITADTIFNTRGTMSGQDVTLAATDSILNAGGTVHGDTVSLTAVNDVISASDTVTFTSPTVTATHIGKQGAITADGDLTVVAGKNIGVFGSDMTAGGDAQLAAGNSVIVSTQALETHAKTTGKGSKSHTDVTTNHGASITAGGSLTVDAGGSVTVHGSKMKAGDDLSVKAGGGVSVTAASDTVDYYDHSSGKSGGLFGGKKSHTTVRQDTTNVASQLESGGDMTIEAGTSGKGAATISGSQLTSGGNMAVSAADDVLVTSVTDQHYAQDDEQKKGTFTSKMALDETRKIDVVRSELDAKGDVLVESRTGDVTVKASHLRAEGGVDIKAEQGSVALLTDKELSYERHVSSDMGWLTWSSRDQGTSAETVLHTLIESGENISITAGDGVTVEYHHTGDARADVRQLAKTPGLEWMAGLLERDDVDWRAVQAVYDTWDHKDGGLGPAAMLVIAIAASVATYGAASQLSMSMMGLAPGITAAGEAATIVVATGEVATATTLAMCTALTAGFVSLSSQVATGLANAAAGGDFKDTLKSIVSEDGARSLLASMILAGTLDTMASSVKNYGMVGQILTVAAVKASVGTIVNGQGVETALLDAVATAFSRYATGLISAAELDKTIEIVLSGAAGAATAAIAGQDPVMGAMSSIVAALANAIAAPPLTEEQKKQGALFSELSECSYKNNCTGTEEFKQLTTEQIDDIQSRGIDISALENNKSGLKTFIFYNSNENQLAVVIRGSQLTDPGDLATNTAELFGLVGEQHTDAALAIQGLKDYAHSQNMTLIATGHSLGGGISSALAAAGLVDGAITFNSSGVNDSTISKIIKSENYEDIVGARSHADSITKAYISRGDMINNFQDILKLFIPTTLGERILVDGGGLHGIEAFNAAFGK
ncbi:filamentous hemagglutinin N-terminal domain-containing protein [Nitratidesulfovibrio termitidis]|uniref:two-partner secretion domain-containing protein n=1 Tax=Nitratidesulfovibrio termitidis TaxID=42252 RepID=UPI0003FE8760|nr:filamentous hemagglutinin N-terminal domain-containing protein [Nitratidesulfovibrio termitidis]